MAEPPPDAKDITNFTNFGLDQHGNWMFFGFVLSDNRTINIATDFHRLGATIVYLQAIAREAEQRRLSKNPHAG